MGGEPNEDRVMEAWIMERFKQERVINSIKSSREVQEDVVRIQAPGLCNKEVISHFDEGQFSGVPEEEPKLEGVKRKVREEVIKTMGVGRWAVHSRSLEAKRGISIRMNL